MTVALSIRNSSFARERRIAGLRRCELCRDALGELKIDRSRQSTRRCRGSGRLAILHAIVICAAPTAPLTTLTRKEVTYQKQQEEAWVRQGGKAGLPMHHTLEFAPGRIVRSGATTFLSASPRSLMLAGTECGSGKQRVRRAQRRRMTSAAVYPTSQAARRESTPVWPGNHR